MAAYVNDIIFNVTWSHDEKGLYDLSTCKPNLKRFDYSYRKLWQVCTHRGIGRCNTGTEQVQDPKKYFAIEKWCSMKC